MNKKQQLYFKCEIKSEESGAGNGRKISGYGNVFNVVDHGNDLVLPGAFAESLKSRKPIFCYNHDMSDIIGWFNIIEEDEHGLKFEAEFVDSERGNHFAQLVKNGGLDGMSIGYITKAAKYNDDGTRTLIEVDLFEVSLVPFPMNADSRISSIKSEFGEYDKRILEKRLRDAGLSRKEAQSLISGGFSALIKSQSDSDEDEQFAENINSEDDENKEAIINMLNEILESLK